MKFPVKARVKVSGKIVNIIDGQYNLECTRYIEYQSDRKDGYNCYDPEELEFIKESSIIRGIKEFFKIPVRISIKIDFE